MPKVWHDCRCGESICVPTGRFGEAMLAEWRKAHAKHHPSEQWVTAPDGEQFRVGACQGHARCPVEKHEHGCFADAGNCDHPEDHQPSGRGSDDPD